MTAHCKLSFGNRPINVEIEFTSCVGGIGGYEFWGARGSQSTVEIDDLTMTMTYVDTNELLSDEDAKQVYNTNEDFLVQACYEALAALEQ